MAQFPPPYEDRHADRMARTERRVKKLEAKTSCIDSGWPLAALPGVISSSYTSGDPMVAINGEPLSGPYKCLASYAPAASDNVLLIPVGVGQTYVVLGRLQ